MPSMMTLGGIALALFLGDAAADAGAAQGTRAGARAPAAAQAQAAPSHTPERAARMSRRKPRILHLPSPSEESPAQRDRRLARECRGLPNAGACLGHALARPRATPRR
ncbi:hypothetical protein [Pantoea sp. 18069]|uniref:hypothetical protein n=1 Tax=Pantoea sp. 18069 TaxID=2681415 RepID=UPI0013588148|nr:hypothetical protein [Pantoea sp. 18069]